MVVDVSFPIKNLLGARRKREEEEMTRELAAR